MASFKLQGACGPCPKRWRDSRVLDGSAYNQLPGLMFDSDLVTGRREGAGVTMVGMSDVTQILQQIQQGDAATSERLLPLV